MAPSRLVLRTLLAAALVAEVRGQAATTQVVPDQNAYVQAAIASAAASGRSNVPLELNVYPTTDCTGFPVLTEVYTSGQCVELSYDCLLYTSPSPRDS